MQERLWLFLFQKETYPNVFKIKGIGTFKVEIKLYKDIWFH
jgi:hypothetical protein